MYLLSAACIGRIKIKVYPDSYLECECHYCQSIKGNGAKINSLKKTIIPQIEADGRNQQHTS